MELTHLSSAVLLQALTHSGVNVGILKRFLSRGPTVLERAHTKTIRKRNRPKEHVTIPHGVVQCTSLAFARVLADIVLPILLPDEAMLSRLSHGLVTLITP